MWLPTEGVFGRDMFVIPRLCKRVLAKRSAVIVPVRCCVYGTANKEDVCTKLKAGMVDEFVNVVFVVVGGGGCR